MSFSFHMNLLNAGSKASLSKGLVSPTCNKNSFWLQFYSQLIFDMFHHLINYSSNYSTLLSGREKLFHLDFFGQHTKNI